MVDDLGSLAHDLSSGGKAVRPYVKAAVEHSANQIKKDWSQGAERRGLGPYSRSIDYELTTNALSYEAEIGPNLGKRQGAFGFVEDGGGGVKSAPQHAGRDALEANEDDFERGLAIAVWDAVLGKGSRL